MHLLLPSVWRIETSKSSRNWPSINRWNPLLSGRVCTHRRGGSVTVWVIEDKSYSRQEWKPVEIGPFLDERSAARVVESLRAKSLIKYRAVPYVREEGEA